MKEKTKNRASEKYRVPKDSAPSKPYGLLGVQFAAYLK